jgi:chorismate mutase
MIESHRDPSCAMSDAAQQVTTAELAKILDKLVIRLENVNNPDFENKLDVLRNRIDAIDAELLEILSSRIAIVKQIGKYKKENNVTALQISRWTQLMDNRVNLGKKLDINETFVKILFQLIHEDSVRMQTEIMDEE